VPLARREIAAMPSPQDPYRDEKIIKAATDIVTGLNIEDPARKAAAAYLDAVFTWAITPRSQQG